MDFEENMPQGYDHYHMDFDDPNDPRNYPI
jgi:hypothetical protein